jgi:hypothetical protein
MLELALLNMPHKGLHFGKVQIYNRMEGASDKRTSLLYCDASFLKKLVQVSGAIAISFSSHRHSNKES